MAETTEKKAPAKKAKAPAAEAVVKEQTGHESSANRSVVRKFAFVRRLHGGDGTFFRARHFNQLLRTAFFLVRNVKVVADKQEKWLISGKTFCALNCVSVTERRWLLHKM